MKRIVWLLLLALTGCASENVATTKVVATPGNKAPENQEATVKPANGKVITTASGLRYEVLAQGSGPEAKAGDTVEVHYTGRLTDGKKFDSSLDRGKPIELNSERDGSSRAGTKASRA